jgi:hypothetical protein
MATVRIQIRRGTAAEWTSANPTLAAGEVGLETDTRKIKFGDGSTAWSSLSYLNPGDIDELSQDAVNAALTMGSGLTKSYNDGSNTLTLSLDTGVVATLTGVQTLTNKTINGNDNTLSNIANGSLSNSAITINGTSVSLGGTRTLGTDDVAEGATNKYFTDERAQDAIGNSLGSGLSYNDTTGAISVDTASIQQRVADVSDTEIGYLNGVTSAIQTQIDAKAPTASPTFTGTVTLPSGTVTSTMIADGAITNDDINASAAIALSKLATDPLARANHTGTQSASTISDFDTQVRTNRLDQMATPTANVSFGGKAITNLAEPGQATDAATKQYVDAATAGLNVHASVKAATTTNITLASAVENGDTLDGVTLATGDRILVKDQTTKADNGVYIVAATGAPTRATDYDAVGEVDAGDFIFVEGGTVNGKTGWVQTNTIATLGTDAVEFTQFAGAGTYTAGTGLTLTGSTFSINTSTTADLSTAQTLTNKTINLTNNTVSGTVAQFNTALSDGDFATLAGTETLTNKTLTSPVISTISNTGTVTLPTSTDTLVGRGTTDTLTNKSIGLGSNTVTGTIAQFNTALTDADFATLAGTETLSNKTLTAPRFATAGEIDDANGAELIKFPSTVASAVNEITVSNAATGSAPVISATGDDTNISLGLTPKGSGVVSANGVLTVTGSTINLNGSTPAISSSSASAASIFTANVTGITIGSSSIKSTLFPTDGTTSTAAAGVGFMGMPQVSTSTSRTFAATDAGKHIYVTATGQTLTIPANSSVAFPIGTTIVVINGSGVSTSIAITTDTLRLSNSASTGTRTLASNGMATLVKINSTEWMAGGNGLT